jgi:hypothetical protein
MIFPKWFMLGEWEEGPPDLLSLAIWLFTGAGLSFYIRFVGGIPMSLALAVSNRFDLSGASAGHQDPFAYPCLEKNRRFVNLTKIFPLKFGRPPAPMRYRFHLPTCCI